MDGLLFTDEQMQMIRNEHETFEKTKQIPEDILEFIFEQKLFKLFVPEAFGGKMLDFPRAVDVFQEASRIDGNFGWIVTIGSGGGMFVPNMEEETAQHFYSPRHAVVAGSGFPAGTAQRTDGGYVINGEWFYCSGSQYANVFTATCFVQHEEEGKREIIAAALDREQVDVTGDWDAFGLKGTSSHTIRVTDQFVPHERMFSVFENQNSHGDFVHTFPFMMFSEASFAAISLGIGKHYLEEVHVFLEKNKANWKKGSHDWYTFLKDKLHAEEARWKIANDHFHDIVESSWKQHMEGENLSEELHQQFSTIAKRSATTAVYCANNLFRYIGMQAVMEQHTLNQIWRDLHTAAQHTFLTPRHHAESIPYATEEK